MRLKLSLLPLALFFAGCLGSKNIVVNETYADADFSQRRVTVLPVPLDAITIRDTALVREEYDTDTREPAIALQDSLWKTLTSSTSASLLKGSCSSATLPQNMFLSQSDTADFFAVKLQLAGQKGDTELTFFVPQRRLFSGDSMDVGLVLNSFDLNTTNHQFSSPGFYTPGHTISTPGGSFETAGHWSMGGSGTSMSLWAFVRFIMWDYRAGRPIVHGTVEAKVLLGHSLFVLFDVTAQRLFEDSPFGWKRGL